MSHPSRSKIPTRTAPETPLTVYTPQLRARLAANLAAFERQPLSSSDLRPAAVALVVVADAAGRACVVLTKRPLTMKRHAGQYALPGGRLDEGETTTEAALRETHEEVGLSLPAESVLGALDDYPTRSGFRITPVVAWAPPHAALEPNPAEVAAIHRVPLASLLEPDVICLDEGHSPERPILSLAILGSRVFAPTAALLLQLREVALLGKSTRVARYDQPRFAWR